MKQISYLLLIFIVVSCTSNTIYKKPENLIPKDSMVLLLTDMYLAVSAKNIKNKKLKSKVNYTALIYEKYKIDSLRFDISNTYYSTKVDDYHKMLEDVKKILESKRDTYERELKIKDSIEGTKKNTKKLKNDSIKRNRIKKLDSVKMNRKLRFK